MSRKLIVWVVAALTASTLTETSAQQVVRGPYLQIGTPTSVVVKWRTDIATTSRVAFGFTADALDLAVEHSNSVIDHELHLSGLSPDTRYYYSIGNTTTTLAGDSSYFFVTSPATPKPTRLWILGDSGTKTNHARNVRDAYYNFAGERHTDLWLMLGDNAYQNGLDSEYQAAAFDMYPEMLRKSVLWPTRGNHDRGPRDEAGDWTEGGDYYQIFALPTAGEAGGMPSGTEAYYSFDYGNIHFICLESTASQLRSLDSPMWTWLEADLASNDKFWNIAFWHHPPYSKGSHDSDTESELIQMRERALPMLESYGVDLVLSGHSHSYERSFLMKGHYGVSNTLADSMISDGGDGRTDGDGAYLKFNTGDDPNSGAVFIVAGSSGQLSPGPLDHPVMFASFEMRGSVVLDVAGNRLESFFINSEGVISDYFSIIKNEGSVAAHLAKISGDGQAGFIGAPLPEPFVVQAQDSTGQPLSGVAVAFSIATGEGALTSQNELTDLNGLASTTLIFGETPGQVIVAATTNAVGDTVLFTAAAEVHASADIAVSPQQHNFGNVLIGDSIAVDFEIKNLGLEDLEITNIAVAGADSVHFEVDSLNAPIVLGTGSSHSISALFKPLTVGLLQSELHFFSNDPDENPLAVHISGFGATEFPQVSVLPKVTTTSTPSNADDPAIWIHPTDPSRSVVIGTDKSAGIYVWDMNGNELQHLPQGTDVNNVDTRQNVRWGNEIADIVAANLRDAAKLAVFKVNPDYTGSDVLIQLAGENSLSNNIQDDSYGFCLYRDPRDSTLYVFELPKNGGLVRQYRIEPDTTTSEVVVTPVRDLNYTGNTAEGFVADDELGFVYVTEEAQGIHKYYAAPDTSTDLILTFGEGDGTEDDREGLAIYACADGTGYLVLSSQGNDTFKIFERQGNNRFLKTILPLDELGNPGLGTDGLDVTSSSAAPNFPHGFVIAHEQGDRQFHIYDWAEIAEDNLAICVDGLFPQPQISVSPANYDFGSVAVFDTAETEFQIRNVGTAELLVTGFELLTQGEFYFQDIPTPFSIAEGDSVALSVAFAPDTVETRAAIWRIFSNDDDNAISEVPLSGSGFFTPRPRIAVSSDVIDFGEVALHDTATAELIVKNHGDSLLTITDVFIEPNYAAFTVDAVVLPLHLEPNDSVSISMAFSPDSSGMIQTYLRIASNDPVRNPLLIFLTGVGVISLPAQIVVSPTAIDFGMVAIDDTASSRVTVKNGGDSLLTIAEVLLLPVQSEFEIDSLETPLAIAPGDSFSINVRIGPDSVGAKHGTLHLITSSGDSLGIPVAAVVFQPSSALISLSIEEIDFGEVKIDSTAFRTLVVLNAGGGDLQLIGIELVGEGAGDFTYSAGVVNITANDSAVVTVEFNPASLGEKNATLLILSNAANEDTVVVSLAGTAVTTIVSVDEDSPNLPDRITLKPSYPNPFNAETTIEYALPQAAHVRLVIYNLLGQPIRVLVDGRESAGFKKIYWNGRDHTGTDLNSGIYYVMLNADGQKFIGRITLLK
jgi:myo-inositol-hexaphosphate 3-phosphohydrolase